MLLRKFILMEGDISATGSVQFPAHWESPHRQFSAPAPPNHSPAPQSESLTCWIINPTSYQHVPSPDWEFSDQKHPNMLISILTKENIISTKLCRAEEHACPGALKFSIEQSHLVVEQNMCVFFFLSVQSLSIVWLFVTPWTAARQASLSITNTQSLLRLMSIESVMPSNHLILCRPLFLPPSIFPSIRVFSSESVLCNRWPKYWSS